MFGGLGVQELLLIFLVVLILFGAKRIPDIAHGLGKGIRDFKRALKDTSEEVEGGGENRQKPSITDKSKDQKA